MIKPALTADEWKGVPPIRNYEDESHLADLIEDSVNGLDRPDFHRAAAIALHAQPFGFTREDVHRLREHTHFKATSKDKLALEVFHLRMAWFASLAARIEALLPPEIV